MGGKMTTTRAERIAAKRRIRERVKNYHTFWYNLGDYPRQLGKVARTNAVCSCEMCQNKRKFEGQTLAERRQMLELKEWKLGIV
jgi:hypothetical protein